MKMYYMWHWLNDVRRKCLILSDIYKKSQSLSMDCGSYHITLLHLCILYFDRMLVIKQTLFLKTLFLQSLFTDLFKQTWEYKQEAQSVCTLSIRSIIIIEMMLNRCGHFLRSILAALPSILTDRSSTNCIVVVRTWRRFTRYHWKLEQIKEGIKRVYQNRILCTLQHMLFIHL